MLLLKQPLPLFRSTKGKEHSLEGQDGHVLGAAEWKGKGPLHKELENLEFTFLISDDMRVILGNIDDFLQQGERRKWREMLQRSKYKWEIHPESLCNRSSLNVALFLL